MDSPCINVCVLDPVSGQCAGCGRTSAEISGWIALTPAERRAIMSALATRPGPHQRVRLDRQEA
jgi:hypothetical protein